MTTSSTRAVMATAVAASIACSGCATPYVVATPDGPPPLDARSIEKALKHLDDTRKVFRSAAAGQIGDEHNASNIFLGAGALITGLALGKVHRDGVLGVAAIAGTGYALANNNLPRSRLQLHLEAVKALNCAERAALPLAISDAEARTLSADIEALRAGRQTLELALERARAANATTDPFNKAFLGVEPLAVAALAQSAQSAKAGDDFLDAGARAAPRLNIAVGEIRDGALSQLATATPPLSAVPQLVQGLAKDMGAFAPGAGIDTAVADAMTKSMGGITKSSVKVESALKEPLEAMEAALRDLAPRQAKVNAALRGRNGTFADDAFKDCNVAQVITALAVTPASPLKFSAQAGGQRVLELKGGVKPYFLQLDGEPVAGLSYPTGPIRGGEAEIALKPGTVTGGVNTGLRASDSSAAGQGVRIEIEVVAAAASAPPPAAPASAPPGVLAAAPIDAALAALKKVSKFAFGGAVFQRKGMPFKTGDKIQAALLCLEGNTAVFNRAALAKAYLDEAKVKDFPPEKLTLTTEPPACAPS